MQFKDIEARPIAGALGAEISGIDTARAMTAALVDDIRAALDQFLVICFRDQDLAINDYDGHRRSMYRSAIAGEVPVGPSGA